MRSLYCIVVVLYVQLEHGTGVSAVQHINFSCNFDSATVQYVQ